MLGLHTPCDRAVTGMLHTAETAPSVVGFGV